MLNKKKKKSSKNEEKENLGRIEYDRFTSDITDDDEEIKSSPFVKKFICEQHSQLSQRPLIRSSSHASQVDLERYVSMLAPSFHQYMHCS